MLFQRRLRLTNAHYFVSNQQIRTLKSIIAYVNKTLQEMLQRQINLETPYNNLC